MRFLLTLHTFRILIGRGLDLKCKCCRMAINVKGLCKCKLCNNENDIIGAWNDDEYELEIKCERCHSPNCTVKYNQYVISKHRKGNHYYYHEECYEGMHY